MDALALSVAVCIQMHGFYEDVGDVMPFETHCPVPDNPQKLTAAWVTERLYANGYLPTGVTVDRLDIQTVQKWNVAQPAILSLDYDGDVPETAPRRLFVKLDASTDPLAAHFPGEVAFYSNVLGLKIGTPHCYAAVRDPELGYRCLLLEDLSESHSRPPWPIPPRFENAAHAIDALAKMHFHFWSPDGRGLAEKAAEIDRGIDAEIRPSIPRFLAYLRDRCSSQHLVWIEGALLTWTELKAERLRAGDGLTRAHGDPHSWNFLYPNDPGANRCVLIDFEDWRPNLAACDLAQMMVLHWSPQIWSRYEQPLLTRYQKACAEAGIDYPANRLYDDYRLAHLCNIHIPAILWVLGRDAITWYPHLERWLDAFETLDCAAFLLGGKKNG